MEIRFSNDPGVYVAHYTRHETAIDLILGSGKLRLGPLNKTNDPRETKSWSFAVGETWGQEGGYPSDLRALASRNPDYNRIIRSGCKILCVSEDSKDGGKLDFHKRAYGKASMWAHYAGNHTGICLIFEKSELHRIIEASLRPEERLLCGPVLYEDMFEISPSGYWSRFMDAFSLSASELSESGLEATLKNKALEFEEVFFFNKSRDWSVESEYRWIIQGQDEDPVFVEFGSSLRAILLGVDFPQSRIAEVRSLGEKLELDLSRIIWMNGQPFVQWVPANEISDPRWRNVVAHFGLV